MYLPNAKAQAKLDPLYDASGVTTGAAQLIRPMVPSCSHFLVQNLSSANAMYVEFGAARATATITNGSVSGFTITNGGFGYTYPPLVRFAGGGNGAEGNSKNLGLNQPGGDGPNSSLTAGRPAIARAVLTAGVVTSIVIIDPGAGYVIAPYVWMTNTTLDPYGAANPLTSSTTGGGIYLATNGGSYYMNGTCCPTDQVSIYCSATAQPFTFKWMV